jgi:Histone-lysine N-methyltransferase NSD-like, PHD zinc finger 1/Inhibitor of growth proteins N-terminal histone-binding
VCLLPTLALKKELDQQCQNVLKNANNVSAKDMLPEENKKDGTISRHSIIVNDLRSIRAKQLECYRLSVEKVALVRQAEIYVSSFRARLEFDSKEFEKDLGARVPIDPFSQPMRPKKRLKDLVAINPPPRQAQPNEQTYCYCKQISHGEMIACDNEDCAIEWFHFKCVGLKRQPKGKWYCDECSG